MDKPALFTLVIPEPAKIGFFGSIAMFFKRITIGNRRYAELLQKESQLKRVGSCITINTKPEDVDVKDGKGNVLMRFTKSISATLNFDLPKMVRELGYIVNESVPWNVTTKTKE